MSRQILVTDYDFTSNNLNEVIQNSIGEYAQSRKIMKRDLDFEVIKSAVLDITQAKMQDELGVRFKPSEIGTDFIIRVIYPQMPEEFENYANSANPHITFTSEGNYFTKRSKGVESLRTADTLIPFLRELLETYLHSATFVAVSSIGLRS